MTTTARKQTARPEIEAIVSGDHGDPFAVLGMRRERRDGALIVRTFQPQASRVAAVDPGSGKSAPLTQSTRTDFSKGRSAGASRFPIVCA